MQSAVTTSADRVEARAPSPAIRVLFGLSTVLVAGAGLSLFVFSERTDELFAWTIGSPLTAAVDGSFFFAALALTVAVLRAQTWAEVRPFAWAVLVFTAIKLAATLITLGPFHLDEGETSARIAAWIWLGVYVAFPPVLAGLIVAQERAPGRDPPPGAAPAWLPAALGALGIPLLLAGGLLLLAPGAAEAVWPWPLTTLTAQALSAWFIALGVLTLLARQAAGTVAIRPLGLAGATAGILLAVALARYGSEVEWARVLAWLFVALCAALVLLGALATLAPRPRTWSGR